MRLRSPETSSEILNKPTCRRSQEDAVVPHLQVINNNLLYYSTLSRQSFKNVVTSILDIMNTLMCFYLSLKENSFSHKNFSFLFWLLSVLKVFSFLICRSENVLLLYSQISTLGFWHIYLKWSLFFKITYSNFASACEISL